MIRAVFLDIDGTLVSIRTHRPAPRTAAALLAAKAAGVRLFIATGRHTAVPEEGYILRLLPDCFDGFVGLTGHYCYARDGAIVHKEALHPDDVRIVKAIAEAHAVPYTFDYEDRVFISRVDERVRAHNASIGLPIPPIGEMDPAREVYSITLYIDAALEQQVLRPQLKYSTTVNWIRGIADVCAIGGGKRAGIAAMLRHFSIAPGEALAIGDSDNDLSMFESVGTAVAMGNGTPAVKAAADFITADCESDGIYQAFAHYGLLA